MLKTVRCGRTLTVYLRDEIDHCCAQTLREEIETMLCDRDIDELVVDFTEVTFMDSSGVGMLIGRYKTMATRRGTIAAKNLSAQMEKLFRLAGLHRIIPICDQEEAANE